FVDRDRLALDEIQKPTQCRLPARLVVCERADFLKGRISIPARRVLELRDRHRIPVVVLALHAILVLAAWIEAREAGGGKREAGGGRREGGKREGGAGSRDLVFKSEAVTTECLFRDQIHVDAA